VNTKKFTRTIENFACEHCGREVIGNGYTNHCPQCLWSKHVDKNPGDRAEACGGMMEPVAAEKDRGEYQILHKCTVCSFARRNKLEKTDNFDSYIALSKDLATRM
jgi:hypothetical protein